MSLNITPTKPYGEDLLHIPHNQQVQTPEKPSNTVNTKSQQVTKIEQIRQSLLQKFAPLFEKKAEKKTEKKIIREDFFLPFQPSSQKSEHTPHILDTCAAKSSELQSLLKWCYPSIEELQQIAEHSQSYYTYGFVKSQEPAEIYLVQATKKESIHAENHDADIQEIQTRIHTLSVMESPSLEDTSLTASPRVVLIPDGETKEDCRFSLDDVEAVDDVMEDGTDENLVVENALSVENTPADEPQIQEKKIHKPQKKEISTIDLNIAKIALSVIENRVSFTYLSPFCNHPHTSESVQSMDLLILRLQSFLSTQITSPLQKL